MLSKFDTSQKQKKTASLSLCVKLLLVCKVDLNSKSFFKKTYYLSHIFHPVWKDHASLLKSPTSAAPCWLTRPQCLSLFFPSVMISLGQAVASCVSRDLASRRCFKDLLCQNVPSNGKEKDRGNVYFIFIILPSNGTDKKQGYH